MGNTQSFNDVYSVQVQLPDRSNRSGVYRHPKFVDDFVSSIKDRDVATNWDLFQMGRAIDGTAKCLGWRDTKPDGTLGGYTWYTYDKVDELSRRLGSALLNLNAVPETSFPDEEYEGARQMRMLGIVSKNRPEWFICDRGASAFNISLVPFYDALGESGCRTILNETQLKTIACSGDYIQSLLDTPREFSHLEHIISFDPIDEKHVEQAKALGIEIHSFQSLLETQELHTPAPGGPASISTVCYTSGTTGTPKGVLLSQRNFVSCVAAAIAGPIKGGGLPFTKDEVYISYLPLAHVFERMLTHLMMAIVGTVHANTSAVALSLIKCVSLFLGLCLRPFGSPLFSFPQGGAIGVYAGDKTKLLDDIAELRPTLLCSVPSVYYKIHDRVFAEVQAKGALVRYLFSSALANKIGYLRRSATTTHPVWDWLVFKKVNQIMGGRLKYMISGGAALHPGTQDNIQALFSVPLCQGYGLTETIGPAMVASIHDPVSGHVGGVLPSVEYCIESVPEMGFTIDSKPPRGELLLRGPSLFHGYFKHPEETRKVLMEDGWFHTGDIVELLPSGRVQIVDRRKNIFKLAQGEYVAPEVIENVYQQASLVSQIFAFGYSDRRQLVGIVVPNSDAALSWAAKNPSKEKKTLEEICSDTSFRSAVLSSMAVEAERGNLKKYEMINAIHLSAEPFTPENGLLTPTAKLRRHDAKVFFENEIDALYAALNNNFACLPQPCGCKEGGPLSTIAI